MTFAPSVIAESVLPLIVESNQLPGAVQVLLRRPAVEIPAVRAQESRDDLQVDIILALRGGRQHETGTNK